MNLKKAKIIRDRLLSMLKPGFQLSDIQEQVFCESWEKRSYREIATRLGYEHDYIRQIGAQLWKMLSQATGKTVTKRNLHTVLQEEYCRWQEASQFPTCWQDWGEATNVSQFWGREAELERLKRWVLSDRCSLVGIVGFGGVGKTALSVKFSQEVQQEFEVVIWRSLRDRPPLLSLLADILSVINYTQTVTVEPSETRMLSMLIKVLQQRRCLLVLDNWDTVLDPRRECLKLYLSGYEGYGELLKYIGEIQHQSCAIVTSREKPDEITTLEGELLPVRIFKLGGLTEKAGAKLIEAKGLQSGYTEVNKLVNYYRGNPLAIKMAVAKIKELCLENVNDFWSSHQIICGGICQLIKPQLEGLSALERQILYTLARSEQPLAIALWQNILSSTTADQITKALSLLEERSLIEKQEPGYLLPPAIAEYINITPEFCPFCMEFMNP